MRNQPERIRAENINTREFWEDTWKAEPAWHEGFGIDPVRFGAMADLLPSRGSIIDIGGARGEFLAWLRDVRRFRGALLHTDITEYACTYARDRFGLNSHRADCYALPFGDASFDAACLGEIIEHLDDPAAALKEAVRVARHRVVISTPNETRIMDRQHVWSWSTLAVLDLMQAYGPAAVYLTEGGLYIIGVLDHNSKAWDL